MTLVKLGYNQAAEEVKIPLTHTLISGTTGKGKSETAKGMILRAAKLDPTLKVIIVDPKGSNIFRNIGTEIPFYIENQTHPLTIKRLLEAKSKIWLKRELPELIENWTEGDSWDVILRKLEDKLYSGKIHPVVKDRLQILVLLLRELIEEMTRFKVSHELLLKQPISKMTLTGMSLGLQQLIVKSIAKFCLQMQNIMLVIDEGHRFAPLSGSSAAKDDLLLLGQEGRERSCHLIILNQTVTGLDDEIRKICQVWLLSGVTDINEANRVLSQLVQHTKLKANDIYQLRTGWFLVNDFINSTTSLCYVQPIDMQDSIAKGIAIKFSRAALASSSEELAAEVKMKSLTQKTIEPQIDKLVQEYESKLTALQSDNTMKEEQLSAKDQELVDAGDTIKKLEQRLELYEMLRDTFRKMLTPEDIFAADSEQLNLAIYEERAKQLPIGSAKILMILVKRYPTRLSYDDLAARTGITKSTLMHNISKYLEPIRNIGLLDGDGKTGYTVRKV